MFPSSVRALPQADEDYQPLAINGHVAAFTHRVEYCDWEGDFQNSEMWLTIFPLASLSSGLSSQNSALSFQVGNEDNDLMSYAEDLTVTSAVFSDDNRTLFYWIEARNYDHDNDFDVHVSQYIGRVQSEDTSFQKTKVKRFSVQHTNGRRPALGRDTQPVELYWSQQLMVRKGERRERSEWTRDSIYNAVFEEKQASIGYRQEEFVVLTWLHDVCLDGINSQVSTTTQRGAASFHQGNWLTNTFWYYNNHSFDDTFSCQQWILPANGSRMISIKGRMKECNCILVRDHTNGRQCKMLLLNDNNDDEEVDDDVEEENNEGPDSLPEEEDDECNVKRIIASQDGRHILILCNDNLYLASEGWRSLEAEAALSTWRLLWPQHQAHLIGNAVRDLGRIRLIQECSQTLKDLSISSEDLLSQLFSMDL